MGHQRTTCWEMSLVLYFPINNSWYKYKQFTKIKQFMKTSFVNIVCALQVHVNSQRLKYMSKPHLPFHAVRINADMTKVKGWCWMIIIQIIMIQIINMLQTIDMMWRSTTQVSKIFNLLHGVIANSNKILLKVINVT